MQINDLLVYITTFVVAAMLAGFGALILANVQTSMTANSAAYNATGAGITGIANMTGLFGSLGYVVIGAVIVGVLIYSFGGLFSRKE